MTATSSFSPSTIDSRGKIQARGRYSCVCMLSMHNNHVQGTFSFFFNAYAGSYTLLISDKDERPN